MPHWRTLMESEWLRFYHLQDKDRTLTITKVEGSVLEDRKRGQKKKMPALSFKETELRLGLNSTNGSTIESLYGADIDKWRGKRITLYPTTTSVGGGTVGCIRVRPQVPKGKGAPEQLPSTSAEQPLEREPGDDSEEHADDAAAQ